MPERRAAVKFKLGDPVRVIDRADYHFDQVGRVTAIDKSPAAMMPFRITGLNPMSPLWYAPNELILAEKEDNQ